MAVRRPRIPALEGTPDERAVARADALALLAEGLLTDEQIAATIGVARSRLAAWKMEPSYGARLQEAERQLRDAAQRFPIANAWWRMRQLQDCCERVQRLIEARAQDPQLRSVPGAQTGLLRVRPTTAGTEYVVDVPLLKELRALARHAALEAGEQRNPYSGLTIDVQEHLERLSQETGIPIDEIIAGAEQILGDELRKQPRPTRYV
jgi:hypothetical protein